MRKAITDSDRAKKFAAFERKMPALDARWPALPLARLREDAEAEWATVKSPTLLRAFQVIEVMGLMELPEGSRRFQTCLAKWRLLRRLTAEREAEEEAGLPPEPEPPPEPVGIVYFVRIGDFIKIGYTAALEARLDQFSTASPIAPVLVHHEPGRVADERGYHARFAVLRHRREWFRHEGDLAAFLAEKAGG